MTVEAIQVPAWRRHVSGLPRPFWYLWTGKLVNRAGSFVAPFLALYLTRERGFSVTEAGLVLTALGVGGALGQPVGGVLADRLGRRSTMVAGMTAAAATLGLIAVARSLPLLCLATLLYGLFLDLYRPASTAAIADLVRPDDRKRAYALDFWAANLGFSIALPLGGLLADRGYGLLFAADAVTCLVMAAVVLRGLPETRPARHDAVPGSFREVVGDPLMLALVVGLVLQASAYMQCFATLPLVMAGDGLSPAAYGVVVAANGVLIVVLQPLLLGVLQSRGRGGLLLAGGLLQGVGLGLTVFADDVLQHVVVVVVWTVGEIFGAGLLSALVAQLAPPHLRGRYMGVFGMSFGISAMLAPLSGTQVLERAGEGALWGGCLVACCVSGVLLLRVSHAADRR